MSNDQESENVDLAESGKLPHLVEAVDDFLMEMVMSTKASPLVVSSIVLARLARLNLECRSIEDFKRLLESSMQSMTVKKESDTTILH